MLFSAGSALSVAAQPVQAIAKEAPSHRPLKHLRPLSVEHSDCITKCLKLLVDLLESFDVLLDGKRISCRPLKHLRPLSVEHTPIALQSSIVLQSSPHAAYQRRVLLQSILLSSVAAPFIKLSASAEDTLNCIPDFAITDKVFLDIAIDQEPVGRIVIGLFGEDVPIGSKRFAEIAAGSRGVSYRKKEFDKVTPSFIQNAGVRRFSLSGGVADAAQFTGGETAEALVPELEDLNRRCPNSTKNIAGAVSIIVKDLSKPPPKPKLIAKDGKFEVIEEELRPDPNGTQFAIIMQDFPQLDASNLVVGMIVDGFDVLKAINSVKVVKDNTSSPYFKAAKLVGDTRAVVAERGFYRPYSKIVVTRSGRLET